MYNVLVVDDEPFILEGLRHIISWNEYGLEITGYASDGTEALRIIENSKTHILITDVRMSKMDGLELIKAVRQKGLNVRCIVLSGYDDFNYVKEAAKLGIENYILKPISEEELISTLLTTIEKIESELYKQIHTRQDITIIRNNILYRWATGDISVDELTEKCKLLSLNIYSCTYLISIIKIMESSTSSLSSIQDRSLLRFSICNICEQVFSEFISPIIFYDLSGDIVLLFTGDILSGKIACLRELLTVCIKNVNIYLKTNIFISMGSMVHDPERLHKSYFHAKGLQEYSLFMPENSIIEYEEVSKQISTRQRDLKIDFNVLKDKIVSGKKDEAFTLICDIYKQLKDLKGITPLYIQNLTIEMLLNITGIVKASHINTEAVLEDFKDLFALAFKMKTVDDIIKWLCEIISRIIDSITKTDESLSPIIKKILHYTNDNYTKDINLKVLSFKFNINTIYLGQLFKREVGETFTNYINRIRIEKAKELLSNTHLKSNEVSEKVGYVNHNYFSRIFKKMTGFSPSEFKTK